MSDPVPNRRRVEMIQLALNANTVHELVTSHGLSLIKDCLCLLAHLQANEDKALMCDFFCRHGGLTVANMNRLMPQYFGGQHTNHCGHCHKLGHQANFCKWK